MDETRLSGKKLQTSNRKLQYKELIDKGADLLEKIESKDVLLSFEDILTIVNSCNNLGEQFMQKPKVENATEYLLDAQVVKMSHDLICGTADQLGNAEFSEREYAESLLNYLSISQGSDNFEKIADEAAKCCKGFRYSLPLLGTFEREERQAIEKERKERMKRQKNTDELKRPENIAALKKTDKGAEKINSYHIQIERICRDRKGCVPYAELITNPDDFMLTVDNAFQVSFLIRDGLIELKKHKGEPHIFLVANPIRSTQSGVSAETVQCVSSINPKLWRENIKRFKIKEPLLISDLECNDNSLANLTQIEDSDSD